MNQCICVDCQNKCYEYENSITSDKAYFEWAHKKDKCKVESDELSDLTPCDDAVSRQEAIDAFQIFREYESNRSNKEWVDRIETVLNQLPPVKTQESEGKE